MPLNLIGDIMIPLEQYPHIPHWFSVRQAIAELEHSELKIDNRTSLPRALLVFDETYELMGIVRRRDILSRLEPRFMQKYQQPQKSQWMKIEVDPDLVAISEGKLTQTMREHAEVPISEVMQPIVATIDHSEHIAKAIYLMVSQDLNLLPVLRDGNVVGVVRSVDVFHEIAQAILEP